MSKWKDKQIIELVDLSDHVDMVGKLIISETIETGETESSRKTNVAVLILRDPGEGLPTIGIRLNADATRKLYDALRIAYLLDEPPPSDES